MGQTLLGRAFLDILVSGLQFALTFPNFSTFYQSVSSGETERINIATSDAYAIFDPAIPTERKEAVSYTVLLSLSKNLQTSTRPNQF